MEIATIITSCENIHTLFDKFIYSYPLLILINKDDDTAYFRRAENDKDKIFYHYKLVNPSEEFGYNYPEDEIIHIKNFYGDRHIYMFDLSYRPEILLVEILKAFKLYLKNNNEKSLSDILISHPFDGLKSLEKDY